MARVGLLHINRGCEITSRTPSQQGLSSSPARTASAAPLLEEMRAPQHPKWGCES